MSAGGAPGAAHAGPGAGPAGPHAGPETPHAGPGAGPGAVRGPWAGGATTLTGAFHALVRDHPDHPFLTLVGRDGDDRTVPLGELGRHAAAVSRLLRDAGGRPGDRVPLVFESGLEAVAGFFGTLLAGMVPALVTPPMGRRQGAAYHEHVRALTERCGSTVGLAGAEYAAALDGAAAHPFLTFQPQPDSQPGSQSPLQPQPPHAQPSDAELPEPPGGGDAVALVQFTSGSTRTPKGVQVTHHNVLVNTGWFAARFGLGPGRAFCSWLPLHHDFGLVGGLLSTLLSGGRLVLLSPQQFIRAPESWLRAAQRHGASVSGSPNFGLALCNRRLTPERLAGLDLSGLRTLVVGSDPVVPATVRAFQRLLGPYGLPERAVRVGYGLAENTLMVSGGAPGQPLRTLTYRRPTGVRGPVRPIPEVELSAITDDGAYTTAVSCGPPADDLDVRIVDEEGSPVGSDVIGEVEVSGPCVAAGYLEDPRATESAFPRRAVLRTGDLGLLHGGEVYLTGRLKDVVIARGRNLNALDVERTVRALPGLYDGECAAFGARVGDGEELVVVAETRPAEPARHADLAQAVTARLVREFGVAPAEVVFVRLRTLPKTTSGKLQRARCADDYARGGLSVLNRHPTGPQ